MTDIKQHIANLENRLLHCEVYCDQLNKRHNALQLVVSWLLAKPPNQDALNFLRVQANELDGNPKHVETVMLLDELIEDVVDWSALQSSLHNQENL